MKDENEGPSDDIATIRLSRTNSADDSDGMGQALVDFCLEIVIRLPSDEEEDYGANNLSSMLATHLDHQYTLQMVFNHQGFSYMHEQQDLSFPSSNAYITLRDLLDKHTFPRVDTDNSKYYSLGDRYLLGLNLAKSLFYLFDGPWTPLNWKAEDICFPATQTSTSMTLHSRHSPYIRFSLNTGNEEENQTQEIKEEIDGLCYPMWVALAQILLELHLGRSLAHEVEALDNAKRRQLLHQLINTELRDRDFKFYKEAIDACLILGRMLLSHQRREREAARELIRHLIIAKLEGNYEQWSSTLGENTDLDLTPNQQSQIPEDIDALNDFVIVKENLKEVEAEDLNEEDEEMEDKDQVMDNEEIWVILA
ncbi:hypothetical protein V8C40DRAFT_281527 [Trichoderma camerunense]